MTESILEKIRLRRSLRQTNRRFRESPKGTNNNKLNQTTLADLPLEDRFLPFNKVKSHARARAKSPPVPSLDEESPLVNDSDQTRLGALIRNIKHRIETNEPVISKIKDPEMLVESLEELNQMVGMTRLKESSALQTMKLIQAIESGNTKMGMLNTILYGKPGVGKTKVGITLAKIWYSLGILETNAKERDFTEYLISNYQNILTGGIVSIYILMYLIKASQTVRQEFGKKAFWIWMFLCSVVAGLLIWVFRKDIYEWTTGQKYESNQDQPLKESDRLNLTRKIISVVSREDFVAQYLGQTATKTKALLNKNKGKVLFIDEAYSLYNGIHDPYGMEALTTLNLFMSENENDIIIIFGGYKDLMQDGIFKVQPGLPRRCMWHFECDDYTGEELAKIFVLQVEDEGLLLEDPEAIMKMVEENAQLFPSFGGDTKRLMFFAQLSADNRTFFDSPSNDSKTVLKTEDIEKGLEKLKENNIHTGNKDKPNISSDQLAQLSNLLENRSFGHH